MKRDNNEEKDKLVTVVKDEEEAEFYTLISVMYVYLEVFPAYFAMIR